MVKESNVVINFIGIGAQKSGSTWLYSRLNELPEFSLTLKKELHYFDRSIEYLSPNVLSESRLIDRLKKGHWLIRAIGKPLQQLLKGNFKGFKWYLKHYFSNYNDKWYLSLFNSLNGIKGEITPSYSILKEQDIVRMNKLAPQSKIIFLLRNPIERAWSNYRHELKNVNFFDIESMNMNEIKQFIDSESQELRSDYVKTIKNYSKIFSKNKIMIGFYDAIIDNPNQLLFDIVDFLGGDATSVYKYCKTKKKDNVSKKIKIPKEIEFYLKQKYHPLIKKLADEFGGYFIKWYNDSYEDKNNFSKSSTLSPTIIINQHGF